MTSASTFVEATCCLPPNKDAALFPHRFGDRYVLLHRPMPSRTGTDGGIWLSFSPDLVHWGDHRRILAPGGHGSLGVGQDRARAAAAAHARRAGSLLYHGVRQTAAGAIYRAGLALLDRRAARAGAGALGRIGCSGREAPYERVGDVGNVVFPCGWVLDDDGDTLRIYYGAADTSVGVATASVEALLAHLGLLAQRCGDRVGDDLHRAARLLACAAQARERLVLG